MTERDLRSDCDIKGVMASLNRLLKYPIRIMFTGSGSVIANPAERIRQKLAYLSELEQKILELHGKGISQARIARQLFGLRHDLAARIISSGHFSSRHLVRSFSAQ